VALLVCDLQQPDIPIVYASEPFIELTGYAPSEIVGRNCRFLQAPGGAVQARSVRQHVDRDTVRRMRKAVEGNTEVQLRVNNFKRDGRMFVNLLTIIPVTWDTEQFRYSVGFQCEVAA
jgi:PAS domain S-box-containing protein